MLPQYWGPPGWIFLQSIAMTYPENPTAQDKQNYQLYFSLLQNVLPCDKCRINCANHLKSHPLDDKVMSSRLNLVMWLIDVHNEVNKLNNKPIVDYATAINNIIKEHDQVMHGVSTNNHNYLSSSSSYISITVLSFIVLIMVIIFIIARLGEKLLK